MKFSNPFARTIPSKSASPTAEWDDFVSETLEESEICDEVERFRCPECSRGLRIPAIAIGRKMACPFCRTVYVSYYEGTEVPSENRTEDCADSEGRFDLAKWVPRLPSPVLNSVDSIADRLRKNARVSAVRASILNSLDSVSNAGTHVATLAAGAASVALPGAGEILSGRTRWGFCTMAAFLGLTAAATASGGVWIAAPIAVRVLSAHSAFSSMSRKGQSFQEAIRQNAEEMRIAAEELAKEAARLDEAEFEKEMAKREEEELTRSQKPSRRLVLVRINSAKAAH